MARRQRSRHGFHCILAILACLLTLSHQQENSTSASSQSSQSSSSSSASTETSSSRLNSPTDLNFRGFSTYSDGSSRAYVCSGVQTFSTSSTHAGCCTPDALRCNFGTACVDGLVAQRWDDITYTCNSTRPACYTATIYESWPSAGKSWLQVGCASSLITDSTIFRQLAPFTTTAESGPTSTPAMTGTSEFAGPHETGLGLGEDDAGESSKAWIAGAVIGPLAAVVLIGLIPIWLRQRRRKKIQEEGDESGGPNELPLGPDRTELGAEEKTELPVDVPSSELPGSPASDTAEIKEVLAPVVAAELPGHEAVAYELPHGEGLRHELDSGEHDTRGAAPSHLPQKGETDRYA